MVALRHYGMGKVFNQGVRAIDVGLGPLRSFTLEGGRQVLDQARRAAPTPLMARG